MSAHEHYRRGLGTALRHNQVAYACSAMSTALFGILQTRRGSPDVGQAWPSRGGSRSACRASRAAPSSRRARGPVDRLAAGAPRGSIGFMLLARLELGPSGFAHPSGGIGGDFDE